jgi:uncharacterized protein YecT (DUF1311 family)
VSNPIVHTGELQGELDVRNGQAVYSTNNGKIILKFAFNKIEVEQEGDPFKELSLGPVVDASGGYIQDKYQGHDSYESCITTGTSEQKVNCSADEFKREDARLNREYRRAIAQYKTQGRVDSITALRKVQVAWLKSMATECDSMRPEVIYECRLYWTKTRADTLAKLP